MENYSFERWKNQELLVLGDGMLDVYKKGFVKKVNPEAPGAVDLKVVEVKHCMGGAANVAHNIRTLSGQPTLFYLVGDDPEGKTLKDLCARENIRFYPFSDGRRTTTKTRLVELKRNHQIARFSEEDTRPLDVELRNAIAQEAKSYMNSKTAIILSDYAKGFLSAEMAQSLMLTANIANIPILVDPKAQHIHFYAGATLIKPNLETAEEIVGRTLERQDGLHESEELRALCVALKAKSNVPYVVITCGKEGIISLDEYDQFYFSRAKEKQGVDVTGAGDTVMAVLGLYFATHYYARSGRKARFMQEAITLANLAGGVVIDKPGTSTVSLEELTQELHHE